MSKTTIDCWSCQRPMTLLMRAEADGNCPHCRVEIDLEQYLHEALMKPGKEPASAVVPDVKRWSVGWGGGSEVVEEVHPQGAYVTWEDYEALRAMLAAAPHPASGEPTREEPTVVGVRISSEGFGSYIADSAMGIGALHPGDVREPLMTVAQHERIIAAHRAQQGEQP